jgi:uncharacterized protein
VVKVKVLEVDVKRRRIGLTMKLNDAAPSNTGTRSESSERSNGGGAKGSAKASSQRQQASSAPLGNTAFAEAFAKLKAKN